MMLSANIRYALTTVAILAASAVQLERGYRPLIVVLGALAFLLVGNGLVYVSGAKERAVRRRLKRDYYAGLLILLLAVGACTAHAQLLGEPPLPAKNKKQKQQRPDLEWLWQYSPPPVDGREHDLIQDPHFEPFLQKNLLAPQSFWSLQTDRQRKTLAETASDFLTIPGKVLADDNRYITVTGAVRHLPTSRGLLFADLESQSPLIVFAAIDWIRASHEVNDAAAEFTLWIFANQAPGPASAPTHLPPALARSLSRWIAEPLAGSGQLEHVTAAILVDPDGTPHQIPVPTSETQK